MDRAAGVVLEAEPGANDGAPIASLCRVSVVTKLFAHQACEIGGHGAGADGLRRLAAEGVAGQRRDDQVEGRRAGGVVAVRVGQMRDQLLEFQEGARPPVHQQQGLRVRPRALCVDEMNVDRPVGAADLRGEVRQAIEPGLGLRPVVFRRPIGDQAAKPVRVRAKRPAAAFGLVVPVVRADTLFHPVQLVLRNVDLERRSHSALSPMRRRLYAAGSLSISRGKLGLRDRPRDGGGEGWGTPRGRFISPAGRRGTP